MSYVRPTSPAPYARRAGAPGRSAIAPTLETNGSRDQEVAPLDLRQLAFNAGWLTAARIVSGVSQFLAFALVARHLGPLSYGHWGFAVAFTALFAVLADFGLSTLAVRDLAQARTARSYIGSVGALKLALNLCVFALIAAVAPLTGQSAETKALIYLLGAQAIVASTTLLVSTVFRAAERMAVEAWITIGQSLLLLLAVVLLVNEGASAPALASAYLGVALVGFVVSLLVLRGRFAVCWQINVSTLRSVMSETWPIGVGMMMTGVYYFFDRLFMGALGQDKQIGLYSAAYAPILMVGSIVNVVRVAFLPAQSRGASKEGTETALLLFYGRLSFILAALTALGGLILAPTAIEVIYGPGFSQARFALQALCVAGGFMFTSSFYGSILLTAGRQRVYLVGVTVGAIVNVSANLPLVPLFSLDGAAVATVLAEAAVTLFMVWRTADLLSPRSLQPFVRSAAPPALVLGATLVLVGHILPFPIALGPAMIACALCAWRTRVLTGETTSSRV